MHAIRLSNGAELTSSLEIIRVDTNAFPLDNYLDWLRVILERLKLLILNRASPRKGFLIFARRRCYHCSSYIRLSVN